MKVDIKSFTLEELTAYLQTLGEAAFRAKQIFAWLHAKQVLSFAEMSDLSKTLREKLEKNCYINSVNVKKKLVSTLDGTVKYLYGLRDGNSVEAVLMKYRHGNSLCISTQVGCRMGCRFCASTIGGLVRNLTASEMLDEVYTAGRDSGESVDSAVLMGIGEPLDNLEEVLRFLRILSHPQGRRMSLRHVSLSTCGLVDGIEALAAEKLPLTLSVSLHAPDNRARDSIMPVNRRWPVEELLAACRRYFEATGRRISYEYALMAGVNDTQACADELADLLQGGVCHVNLIPVNSVAETGYHKGSRESVRRFAQWLERRGVTATVRRELGADINAACGQLRRESERERAGGKEADEGR